MLCYVSSSNEILWKYQGKGYSSIWCIFIQCIIQSKSSMKNIKQKSLVTRKRKCHFGLRMGCPLRYFLIYYLIVFVVRLLRISPFLPFSTLSCLSQRAGLYCLIWMQTRYSFDNTEPGYLMDVWRSTWWTCAFVMQMAFFYRNCFACCLNVDCLYLSSEVLSYRPCSVDEPKLDIPILATIRVAHEIQWATKSVIGNSVQNEALKSYSWVLYISSWDRKSR